MIALQQLSAIAGLAGKEMVLGVTPSTKHDRLLSGYVFNIERGPVAVRDMIVADLRRFLDLGARREAADRLIVLRRFLSKHPNAEKVPQSASGKALLGSSLSSSRYREREDRTRKEEAGPRVPIKFARQKTAANSLE